MEELNFLKKAGVNVRNLKAYPKNKVLGCRTFVNCYDNYSDSAWYCTLYEDGRIEMNTTYFSYPEAVIEHNKKIREKLLNKQSMEKTKNPIIEITEKGYMTNSGAFGSDIEKGMKGRFHEQDIKNLTFLFTNYTGEEREKEVLRWLSLKVNELYNVYKCCESWESSKGDPNQKI